MAATQRWIAVSAVSALGVGLFASGAVGVANAMTLVNSSTVAAVPAIVVTPDDSGRSGGSNGTTPPLPSTSPNPTAVPSSSIDEPPDAPPLTVTPQPVAPRPAETANDSVASVVSAVSAD